jgi:hypothetical protein
MIWQISGAVLSADMTLVFPIGEGRSRECEGEAIRADDAAELGPYQSVDQVTLR